MPRKKPLIPVTPKTEVVPKDLQDIVGALRAIVGIQKLLQKGHFKYEDRGDLELSFKFLEELHKPSWEAAQKHECSHMIPGLKEESVKIKEKVATLAKKAVKEGLQDAQA